MVTPEAGKIQWWTKAFLEFKNLDIEQPGGLDIGGSHRVMSQLVYRDEVLPRVFN